MLITSVIKFVLLTNEKNLWSLDFSMPPEKAPGAGRFVYTFM